MVTTLLLSSWCSSLRLEDSQVLLSATFSIRFSHTFSIFLFIFIFLFFNLFLFFIFLSDQQAGTLYGVFGALNVLYGLIVGFIVDNIGVRWALIIGLLVQSIAKFALAFATSTGLVYTLLYGFIPLGEAMSIPVINTSLRRYTTLPQRAFTYGLLYSFMNFGIVASGWGVDILRITVGTGVKVGEVVRGEKRKRERRESEERDRYDYDSYALFAPPRLSFHAHSLFLSILFT